MSSPSPLLELDGISKSFGAAQVLKSVSFAVHTGEVHVLAGENGAGKSTLIRILSGVYSDYQGSLRFAGKPLRVRTPRQASDVGIATIHQELSLVPALTIADNLMLTESGKAWSWVSRKRAHQKAVAVLGALGLDLDPACRVETLPLALQQLLEIARALSHKSRLFVMDEPTSALNQPEAERLFGHIEQLRQKGAGVLYISHRMEEIYRLADRITVLRDGAHVLTARAADLPRQDLLSAMIGRQLALGVSSRPKASAKTPTTVLEVRELTLHQARLRPPVDGVSFTAAGGEIVGIAGLRGSGASELLHALFGTHGSSVSGQVFLGARELRPRSPRRSIGAGLMLLPNDRKLSVFGSLSVIHNATLSGLGGFSRGAWVRKTEEHAAVGKVTAELRLRTPSLNALAESLSGGNQQKLALCRCLLAKPSVLLLDEPTRGIDVGAKAEVYELIRRLSGAGLAILFTASEMDELILLSHRILVLSGGRLVREFARSEFSREQILQAAMGSGEGP